MRNIRFSQDNVTFFVQYALMSTNLSVLYHEKIVLNSCQPMDTN